jgi:twinkle protein
MSEIGLPKLARDGSRSASSFVSHEPCETCGSSDAKATYDDGHTFCFSCHTTTFTDAMVPMDTNSDYKFLEGTYKDIPNRKLSEATCRHYNYQVGEGCHIANYRSPKDGSLVAQKIRRANKEFSVVGLGKHMPLYGQHLWSSGKSVVITEGEIDCLSVAQAFNCKWPVVSLPNGADSAAKVISRNIEYLSGFDKVVLCFDQDAPGRKALEAAAQELPLGKAYIMRLPEDCKDANEALVKHGAAPIVQGYWNAQVYRPDGILSLSEFRESVVNPVLQESLPYPWESLNTKTRGIRKGELVVVCAGSGLGKSTFVKEILYDIAVNHDKPVGLVFLEEQGSRTAEILVGMRLNKNLMLDRSTVTTEELEAAFSDLSKHKISLYSHFGSNDVDNICNKIRFMVQAEGCQYVFLDHLSILVSDQEGDERKLIDATMTKLRTLVSELGFSLFVISHLKRPQGDKGHEDGLQVSLGQLRGSHAIAQLSDFVIGLEKDKEDPTADTCKVVVLKNRLTGDRGYCGTLFYDRDTGRLTEGSF